MKKSDQRLFAVASGLLTSLAVMMSAHSDPPPDLAGWTRSMRSVAGQAVPSWERNHVYYMDTDGDGWIDRRWERLDSESALCWLDSDRDHRFDRSQYYHWGELLDEWELTARRVPNIP